MPKGKPKPKSRGNEPDKWVRRLVRGRVDLDPDIVPTIVVMLDMLRERYTRERGKILGRASGLDPSHFSPLADRFQRLIDSVSTIAVDLLKPHSGIEFDAAVARVLTDPGEANIGTPPAFRKSPPADQPE